MARIQGRTTRAPLSRTVRAESVGPGVEGLVRPLCQADRGVHPPRGGRRVLYSPGSWVTTRVHRRRFAGRAISRSRPSYGLDGGESAEAATLGCRVVEARPEVGAVRCAVCRSVRACRGWLRRI